MNDPQDVTIEEALRLREALSWVKNQGMTNVIFEIDARSMVLRLHKCHLDTLQEIWFSTSKVFTIS